MYLDAKSALTLYKVNLQFFFRLCDLQRENALRWSEAGNRAIAASASELEKAATRMLDASDWNSLAFVYGDLYWKALQLQNTAAQHLAETSLSSHGSFSSATQEAVSTWQKQAAAALKETAGAMPISTSLQEFMQDYLHLFTPQPDGTKSKGAHSKAH